MSLSQYTIVKCPGNTIRQLFPSRHFVTCYRLNCWYDESQALRPRGEQRRRHGPQHHHQNGWRVLLSATPRSRPRRRSPCEGDFCHLSTGWHITRPHKSLTENHSHSHSHPKWVIFLSEIFKSGEMSESATLFITTHANYRCAALKPTKTAPKNAPHCS